MQITFKPQLKKKKAGCKNFTWNHNYASQIHSKMQLCNLRLFYLMSSSFSPK